MPRFRCWRPYAAPDERDAGEVRVVEVRPDADERPLRAEARPQQVEHGGPLLEHLEQAPVRSQLVRPELVQDAGRPADVERLLLGLEDVRERRAHAARGTRARARRAPASSKRLRRSRAPRRRPANVSFRYCAGPLGEARVDRLLEGEEPLRHASRRRDHDDHDDLRLEQQDLDVAHDRRLERRRRHEREQVRQVRERLGRRAERRVDLALARPRGRARGRPDAARAGRAAGRRRAGSPRRSARARRTCAGA